MNSFFLLRSRAQSLSILILWIFNGIIGAAYPPINEIIGGSIFFVFAAFNVLAIIFVFFCLPETKNKSITEIKKYFASESKVHNSELSAQEWIIEKKNKNEIWPIIIIFGSLLNPVEACWRKRKAVIFNLWFCPGKCCFRKVGFKLYFEKE